MRRLAIWEAPGRQKIRDIELRPGLNIVWSPDGFDDTSAGSVRAIGHGSGKTLFCRLLRYCLGEQRFADETQRESIALALSNGVVGAEVMLDGVCWAVVRPLGMRRRHPRSPMATSMRSRLATARPASIDPLIEAIEHTHRDTRSRGPGSPPARPKSLADRARLAYPQSEMPIRRHLSTGVPRHPGSDAPLPASGRETGPRREALRAFLMAITEKEQQTRRAEEALRAEVTTAEREASYLDWDRNRRQERLIGQLGLDWTDRARDAATPGGVSKSR